MPKWVGKEIRKGAAAPFMYFIQFNIILIIRQNYFYLSQRKSVVICYVSFYSIRLEKIFVE